MDRFEGMRAFLRTVELGSISAAAQALALTQPAVSKRLMHLEKHLGARLLQRNTRGIRLTSAGERYYALCRQVVRQLEAAEEELASEQGTLRGRLRLNVVVSLGEVHLTRIAVAFQQQHPELQIELVMTDKVVDLVEDGTDVGVRMGALRNVEVIARPLGYCEHVLAATPEYLRKHGVPERPEDLADKHSYVRYSHSPIETIERGGKTVSFRPREPIRFNNSLAATTAMLAGLGIGSVMRFRVEEQIQRGEIQVVLPGWATPPLALTAVYLPVRPIPKKVLTFVEFLAREMEHVPGFVPVRKRKSASSSRSP